MNGIVFALLSLSICVAVATADNPKLSIVTLTNGRFESESSNCYKNCVKADGRPSDCMIECFGTPKQKECAKKCAGNDTEKRWHWRLLAHNVTEQIKECFQNCVGQ
ncbi:hypothetical protein Ddc_13467 [Ditylenchus destructor]|nr:hypothetical protein Ddc_13467 [Ditylenchus destructor]